MVVYTWNFHPELIDERHAQGGERLPRPRRCRRRELVAALEAIHAGETRGQPSHRRGRGCRSAWTGPGDPKGSPNRESEILALITQGKSNAEVAAMTFLSMNSVKSYIRSAYRKIGVTSRTQAVLWGIEHGFRPDHHRIDHWRGGP